MDSDDFMSYDRLEKQIEFLKENPDIGVVASRVKYSVTKKLPCTVVLKDMLNGVF